MFKKAKNLVLHPLLSGSFIMLVGTNLANFLAYIYHLIFGRLLGPSVYGELVAILSLAGLFMSAFGFLSVSIVKFVSSGDEKQKKEVYSFIQKKLVLPVGVIAAILFLVSPLLSSFLKIESLAVYLIGPIIFFAFLHQVYASFLQGKIEFEKSVIVNNLGWASRIVVGLILFYLGSTVFGATFAYFFGFVVAWYVAKRFVGYKKVKRIYDSKLGKEFIKYSLPVLVMAVSFSSFISTDVVLARHFLEAHTSGIYSSLSTLGKIIFYASFPIAGAMFPLSSKKSSEGQSTKYLFLLNLLLTVALSVAILLAYWLLPKFVVGMLYGSEYLEAAPYLLWAGVFFFFFAINKLFASYYLSREKTNSSYIVMGGAILQVLGIIFFHETLMSIILVNITTSFVVLVAFVIYGLINYGFVFSYGELKSGVNQFKKEI